MSDIEEKKSPPKPLTPALVVKAKPKAKPEDDAPPEAKSEDDTTKTFRVRVVSNDMVEKNRHKRPKAVVKTVKANSKKEALEKTKGAFAAYEVKE